MHQSPVYKSFDFCDLLVLKQNSILDFLASKFKYTQRLYMELETTNTLNLTRSSKLYILYTLSLHILICKRIMPH